MRKVLFISCIFFSVRSIMAQDMEKLMHDYDTAKTTDSKAGVFFRYYGSTQDSVPYMIMKLAIPLHRFESENNLTGMGVINLVIADKYVSLGDYANALKHGIYSLKYFEDLKDSSGAMRSLYQVGNSLLSSKNFEQALFYLKRAEKFSKNYGGITHADHLNGIAYSLVMIKKPDSAFTYIKTAIDIGWEQKDTISLAYYIGTFGEAYLASQKYDLAKPLIIQSLQYALQYNLRDLLAVNSNDLSQLFYETGKFDSAVFYARKGMDYGGTMAYLLDSFEWLYKAFERQEQKDSVSKYFRLAATLRDSLYSAEKDRTVQALNFQQQLWEKEREQAIVQAEKDFTHRLTLYTAFGIVIIIIIIALLLYRNSQHQKKSKIKVEAAYAELKSTQTQLIQSEKMASLGALTAGIAHEIQNPLNFVNNFSEVNKELAEELKSELAVGNLQLAAEITSDIITNSEKINHHGKRADSIVKGMLQHSRTSTGQKELTDINALADEYLRLSYHGIRAKDPQDAAHKNFNATIQTDFDKSIGKINIVPQDIARVLLNLYNNAFYAVREKAASEELREPGAVTGAYEPTVSVSTKKAGNKVLISVADNGNGIPENIIDKIFQPFFTTKPTGQGTGLGLSLAYDIVKAHGGEISVTGDRNPKTNEDEGTTFIVVLPA